MHAYMSSLKVYNLSRGKELRRDPAAPLGFCYSHYTTQKGMSSGLELEICTRLE